MSKKTKIFAIVVLVIAAVIAVVAFTGRSSTSTAPVTNTDSSLSSSAASKVAGVPLQTTTAPASEFATVLSTIKSITLNTSIFDDPAYKALRNYPIALGSDNRGRANPFAPVGYEVGTVTGTPVADVQFETLQPLKITSTTAEFGAQGILNSTDVANVVFEYGVNDLLGSATAPVVIGKNGAALLRVTGLIPKTTYYVRAVLTQGAITKTGNIMTFTTLTR
jgi:hypothetical protein